jgi:hypothetical protein
MATVLLTDRCNPECVTPERANARVRLSTYLHACRLDRELAAGASPDSSVALSLRAQTLIGSSARARLAGYVERLLDEAGRPLVPLAPGVRISRRTVRASRPALLELAQRLVSPEPIDARGVAYAGVLLTATDGRAYDNHAEDHFEPALRAAIAALEPNPGPTLTSEAGWRAVEDPSA